MTANQKVDAKAMVDGKEVWLPAQVTEVHEEGAVQRIKVH